MGVQTLDRPTTHWRPWAHAGAIVILAVGIGIVGHTFSPSGISRLAWSDEFSGKAHTAPDPAKWRPQVGGDGWGNQELECYTDGRDNSALDGRGHLVITVQRAPQHVCADGKVNDYTSARLMSTSPYTALYGKIEIRAELPVQPGVWPALWALGASKPKVGWPDCGEIDIAEVAGVRPREVHSSLHGPAADGSAYSVTKVATLPRPVNEAFHVYAVTWTPSSFTFSVDGHDTLRASRATVDEHGTWVFSEPFQLVLNVAVGGQFGGPPTYDTKWPRRMSVDYVRVFR
jgi:beta-glucanase (GH16 family)